MKRLYLRTELNHTHIRYPVYIALYFNTSNFSIICYQADSLKILV